MLKVKSGDLDKLGLLFERYNRRLFGYFYRLTRRRELSEDLVQGVFERILKYRYTYENSGAFSTWIFQIARNLHMDHLRKQYNGHTQDDEVNLDAMHDDTYPVHMKLTDEGDSRKAAKIDLLKCALDRLDPKKKEPLILSRYEGFTYKEIASITDCSVSAVKVRVFRAMNELREIIHEMQNEKTHE